MSQYNGFRIGWTNILRSFRGFCVQIPLRSNHMTNESDRFQYLFDLILQIIVVDARRFIRIINSAIIKPDLILSNKYIDWRHGHFLFSHFERIRVVRYLHAARAHINQFYWFTSLPHCSESIQINGQCRLSCVVYLFGLLASVCLNTRWNWRAEWMKRPSICLSIHLNLCCAGHNVRSSLHAHDLGSLLPSLIYIYLLNFRRRVVQWAT